MILSRCTASIVAPVLVSLASSKNICTGSRFIMSEKDSLCAEVVPVNLFRDNYSYLLRDRESGATACVDPAEAGKVLDAAKQRGWNISKVLTTHK